MRLREWDPRTATEAELGGWLTAYNASVAADVPGDPQWTADRLDAYLTVTMPGEEQATWLADSPNGAVGGYGRLLMMSGMAVIELFVAPPYRRSGLGLRLLTTMAEHAFTHGYVSLGVEVVGGTAAERFYEAAGFAHVYTEERSILDFATVDWNRISDLAEGVVTGYSVEFHASELPETLLPAYAQAKQVRQSEPAGDLELRPSSFDVDRLRASLRCLRERGLRPYVVLALHDRSQSVAGLTELVVPAQHPTRCDQYDTIILPEHDGYGLARALKARMLVELRSAEPQLRQVQTWHAPQREQLQQINKELGFVRDCEWREYEMDAHEFLSLRLLRG